jgi:tetratricopeptide (TPR) repeat protein
MKDSVVHQLIEERIPFERENVERALEEVGTAFEAQDWDTVIEWRDALHYLLDQNRYWQEAVQLDKWAIEAAEETGEIRKKAHCYHDLADIKAKQGYYHEVEPFYRKSFRIFEEQLDDRLSATKCLHMLAMAERALGSNAEAESLAHHCLERAEQYNFGPWRAHPLHLLALIARDRKTYEEALGYLEEALSIHKQHNTHDQVPMVTMSYQNMAETLIRLGRAQAARARLEQAIEWQREHGQETDTYKNFKLYGDILTSQGAHSEALRWYHRAKDRAQVGQAEIRVAESDLKIGVCYLRLGEMGKALGYIRNAISQLRRVRVLRLSHLVNLLSEILIGRSR